MKTTAAKIISAMAGAIAFATISTMKFGIGQIEVPQKIEKK